MKKLSPVGDKIVLKRVEAKKTTESGIVLPDSAQGNTNRGKVLAVGEGKLLDDGRRAKPSCSVGQEVLFNEYSAMTIQHEGEDLLIVGQDAVLAVVV
jgi:chaperonin GroES